LASKLDMAVKNPDCFSYAGRLINMLKRDITTKKKDITGSRRSSVRLLLGTSLQTPISRIISFYEQRTTPRAEPFYKRVEWKRHEPLGTAEKYCPASVAPW